MPLAQPLASRQWVNQGNKYYIGSGIALREDGTATNEINDSHRWRYNVLKWEDNYWKRPNPPTIDILVTTSSEEWGWLPAGHAERPPDPDENDIQGIMGNVQLQDQVGGKRRKSTKKWYSKKTKSKRRKSKKRKNSKSNTKRRRRSTKGK